MGYVARWMAYSVVDPRPSALLRKEVFWNQAFPASFRNVALRQRNAKRTVANGRCLERSDDSDGRTTDAQESTTKDSNTLKPAISTPVGWMTAKGASRPLKNSRLEPLFLPLFRPLRNAFCQHALSLLQAVDASQFYPRQFASRQEHAIQPYRKGPTQRVLFRGLQPGHPGGHDLFDMVRFPAVFQPKQGNSQVSQRRQITSSSRSRRSHFRLRVRDSLARAVMGLVTISVPHSLPAAPRRRRTGTFPALGRAGPWPAVRRASAGAR